MGTANLDYTSLYPQATITFDSAAEKTEALIELLRQRANEKKMRARLDKIDSLINEE